MLDDLLNSLTEGFFLLLQVVAGLLGTAIGLAVLAGLVWMVWMFIGLVPFPIGV